MNSTIVNVLLYGFIVAALYFYFFYIRKEISADEYKELKDWVTKYPELIARENLTRVSRSDFLIIKKRYKSFEYYERKKAKEMKDNPDLVNSRNEFLDSIKEDET